MNVWNYSPQELLRFAENEGDQRAISLYEYGRQELLDDQADAVENSNFPKMYDDEKFELVNFLYTEAEFIKVDEGRYVLDGFNPDTNVYHNEVEIESEGGRNYKITIACEAFGEHGEEYTIQGLANAKSEAIKKAAKLVIEGRLNN